MDAQKIKTLFAELTATPDYNPDSISVDTARAIMRQTLSPVCEVKRVLLADALHGVTAEPIISPIEVPSFDNAAMDGYALRFNDLHASSETPLTQIGVSLAGHPFTGIVGDNQCARVMTGAAMPEGADSVIMQEDTRVENGTVICAIGAVTTYGQNRRFAGEYIKKGDVVIAKGVKITPAIIGVLASLGFAEIPVYRPLRVAFFSTGDELTPPGAPLLTGKIYDSNRFMLAALLKEENVTAIDMGVIPDAPSALEAALDTAAQKADAIISIGGVSVGDADYMKAALENCGEMLFWRVKMKPGRPLAFGILKNAVFFGLPGNPVSSIVTFREIVRDALAALQGQTAATQRRVFTAQLSRSVKKSRGRAEFVRGFYETREGKTFVAAVGNQSSGDLSSMARANCFIVLPQESGALSEGSIVEIEPI